MPTAHSIWRGSHRAPCCLTSMITWDPMPWKYQGIGIMTIYIYYHGRCSDELKSIIPPKACFTRNTRFADSQHSFAVKFEKCRTSSFANTFVPMTSRNWNSLPASIFPSTYNLQTFKTRVHKHLRLNPLTWSTFRLFSNARIFRDS